MTKTTKSAKLSQTMEEALAYLGRGAYRAHLEPEKRTVLALERRGMIVWSERAELGAVGGHRVHDLTRLWDVTEAGWAFLKEAYDMDRPADDGRLTVEEALELVLVDGDRMYDHTEVTARFRSAHRFSSGALANVDFDASGITAFLVKMGLATEVHVSAGVSVYSLTHAGRVAAEKDAKFWNDEDGDVAMDADVLAAANFAARRPAVPAKFSAMAENTWEGTVGELTAEDMKAGREAGLWGDPGYIGKSAPEGCTETEPETMLHRLQGDRPVSVRPLTYSARVVSGGDGVARVELLQEDVPSGPTAVVMASGRWFQAGEVITVDGRLRLVPSGALASGDPVIVRQSLFDIPSRTWAPQAPVEGFYHRSGKNALHAVTTSGGTNLVVRREEITLDDRLSLTAALELADLIRRTGLGLGDTANPAVGWPTA